MRGRHDPTIFNVRFLDSALERYLFSTYNGSGSPKLDEAGCPGDGQVLNDDRKAIFGSAVLTLLYLSKARSCVTSYVRLSCSGLETPDQKDERLLNNVLWHIQETKCGSTEFKPNGVDPDVCCRSAGNCWARAPRAECPPRVHPCCARAAGFMLTSEDT